ncbi:NAD(P)/FAD-dependent oxidoreductase [Nocardia inohanensis]|uniref:NAD(P)/FAD-dependent oxidoreductase n=1 Tax=Nocardia inohanensis TaxID=209246 RepID=UPI00082DC8FD|nr:FAD-dependent oxidoreductase [Nocardia inohanensis]
MSTDDITYSTFTGWIDPPADLRPSLDSDITCEVAVIGGGVGGMATALRLADRGIDTVLLEAEFCGYGASSRNAGQLTGAPAGDPQILSALYPRRFPKVVRFAEDAVDFFEKDLLQRFDIACDYESTGNVGAAFSKGQLRKARRIAKILTKAGAHAKFGDNVELGLPDTFYGGFLEAAGGQLNPGKFCLGLRKAVIESNARVYERSPMRSIDNDGSQAVIHTPGGKVRAKKVVSATNAYTAELGIAPKRSETPIWVSMVETAPIDPARITATGWTSRSGIITEHNLLTSFRITPRNSIAFGVRQLRIGRGALPARTSDPAVVADLIEGFRAVFPSLHDVPIERTWGGWIAMTPSWLPVAGQTRKDNVYYSIGCNGHGLAQAPYLGTLIADLIAGDEMHENLEALWNPRPWFGPGLFKEPLLRATWAVDRLADRFTRPNR